MTMRKVCTILTGLAIVRTVELHAFAPRTAPTPLAACRDCSQGCNVRSAGKRASPAWMSVGADAEESNGTDGATDGEETADAPVRSMRRANGDTVPTAAEETSFMSGPRTAFLEDVDAYGVMWHVNYLRAYDRAIHSCLTNHFAGCANDTGSATRYCVLDYPDWTVTQVHKQRFKSAIRLGDEFVVEGQLVSRDGDVQDVWSVSIRSNTDPDLVYNTAQLVIGRPLGNDQRWIPAPRAFDIEPAATYVFEAHRDEFDPHLSTHLPLFTAMNHMERSRTTALGGAAVLRRMSEEESVVFYVIAADGISLVQMNAMCQPGDRILSQVTVAPRKRGTIVDFYHTLMVRSKPDPAERSTAVERSVDNNDTHDVAENRPPRRMAQAKITVLAFDEARQKPVRCLPQWMMDVLDRHSIL